MYNYEKTGIFTFPNSNNELVDLIDLSFSSSYSDLFFNIDTEWEDTGEFTAPGSDLKRSRLDASSNYHLFLIGWRSSKEFMGAILHPNQAEHGGYFIGETLQYRPGYAYSKQLIHHMYVSHSHRTTVLFSFFKEIIDGATYITVFDGHLLNGSHSYCVEQVRGLIGNRFLSDD